MIASAWLIVGLTFGAFALAMLGIGIGVLLSGKCIRGSCGGLAVRGPDGDLLNCSDCPVRQEAEDAGDTSTLEICDARAADASAADCPATAS